MVLPGGDSPTPQCHRGGSVLRGLWRLYRCQQQQAEIPEVSPLQHLCNNLLLLETNKKTNVYMQ